MFFFSLLFVLSVYEYIYSTEYKELSTVYLKY